MSSSIINQKIKKSQKFFYKTVDFCVIGRKIEYTKHKALITFVGDVKKKRGAGVSLGVNPLLSVNLF